MFMKVKVVSLSFLFLAEAGQLHAQEKLNGEDQFLSRVRQLTIEGRRSGEGYFSPDGKNIIFQSERK